MSVHRYYRLAVWLPLVIPGLVWAGARLFGLPAFELLHDLAVTLLLSLLYGGVPYAVLAAWATWWIDCRDETEIRRQAFRAPLLMLAAFVPFALTIGAAGGHALGGAMVLLLFGAPYILVLGYGYVGLVFLIRRLAQRAGWLPGDQSLVMMNSGAPSNS
jgi:hypothetical protein